MATASFTPVPSLSTISSKAHRIKKLNLALLSKRLFLTTPSATDDGAGMVSSAALDEKLKKKEESSPIPPPDLEGSSDSKRVAKFEDPRWVGGTWDLNQFKKEGKTDWDSVIDAEVKRRKWLQDNPETSSNDEPTVFDTSIIPWWSWVKRFHLPEAELLNGRAAMIGFFMAYLVDSLTGVGLVDQTGNFVCKLLLFVTVVGVLLIRKNEDVESLKNLIKETTFYDKQWQASWQDDSPSKFDKE